MHQEVPVCPSGGFGPCNLGVFLVFLFLSLPPSAALYLSGRRGELVVSWGGQIVWEACQGGSLAD